jgi:hypothetical protein
LLFQGNVPDLDLIRPGSKYTPVDMKHLTHGLQVSSRLEAHILPHQGIFLMLDKRAG